jgi:hypothetical protein
MQLIWYITLFPNLFVFSNGDDCSTHSFDEPTSGVGNLLRIKSRKMKMYRFPYLLKSHWHFRFKIISIFALGTRETHLDIERAARDSQVVDLWTTSPNTFVEPTFLSGFSMSISLYLMSTYSWSRKGGGGRVVRCLAWGCPRYMKDVGRDHRN